MTFHLPEHLEQFVHDQVRAGRYSSQDAMITVALEQLRQRAQPVASSQGSLGAMQDAADELDEVVEHAMQLRRQPWRALPGE
jgi:putative addiction module CopG family antidote